MREQAEDRRVSEGGKLLICVYGGLDGAKWMTSLLRKMHPHQALPRWGKLRVW